MKKSLKLLAFCFLAIGLFGIAYAQFAKPENAIEYRQSVMVLLGHHFSQIAAVVQGKKPFDPKEVEKNAMLVDTLAKLPWEAFMVPGAEKGKTYLNAKAFSKDQAGFKAHADEFMTATNKLAKVSAEGNLDAIKAQFGAVGKSCKGCHVQYRTQ